MVYSADCLLIYSFIYLFIYLFMFGLVYSLDQLSLVLAAILFLWFGVVKVKQETLTYQQVSALSLVSLLILHHILYGLLQLWVYV